MLHQRAAEVVCFVLIAAIGVRLAAAQVTCYTSSTTCISSTSFSISGSNAAGQCCVSRGGQSYKIGTAACKACVVYGFFNDTVSNTPLTNISHKEGSQLNLFFGYVNGSLTGIQAVSFSVPDNPTRYIKAFISGVTNSNKNSRVQFGLNVLLDNVALEPPLLVPVTATVANSNEFVIPFSITILDADVLTIGFRESDYSVTEGEGQYPPIRLAKDKRIARPLAVQVIPMRLDQFRLLNITLPAGITYDGLTNPAQYNPNGLQEFDYTPHNVTFTTLPNDDVLSPIIRIVEDGINNAEHQFICIVKVFDTSLITSGSVIIGHPSVIIRIVDADIISIGFEFPSYTFTKGGQGFYSDTIKLVKDDGVVSKQTFSIRVTAEASAVNNQAIYGVDQDYDIGGTSVQTFTMYPDQQYLSIPININNNDAVKGLLQAILVSARIPNTPVYNTPHNPTTTIIILDNNVAIVGFVNDTVITVTEGEDFTGCVAVTQPTPDVAMLLSFYLNVDFIPPTADTSDVLVTSTIIGPFDNDNRIVCFTETALPDMYFEGNQTFQYSLSLATSDQPSVMVSPNTTMVTILDNTTLTIGFYETEYAVNKSQSYVTFNVSILGDVWIQGTNVGVMFSTKDGTARAGQDYNQTSQLLIFNDTSTDFLVTVGIINNGYYEDDQTFGANLALQSADGYKQFVTISPSLATATIINDINGVTIGFDQTSYSVTEGQGFAHVQVRVLQGKLRKSVTVLFSTIDGSAVGFNDYNAMMQNLTFDEFTHSLTVNVPILDDGLAKDDKTFSAQLSLVSPQTSDLVVVAPATTNITIINGRSVTIGFQQGSYNVSKHQGYVTLKVKVLQGMLGRTVFLRIQTSDGSAIASRDYSSIDYILPSLNSSVTELTVDIPITGNELAEDDKDFSVQLFLISPTSRISIAPSTTQVTIIDNNSVTIGFQQGSYNVSKHQGYVTLKVKVLQGILGRTVSLRIQTSDGSAIAPQDYSSIDYILPSMNSSVTELTVDIPITVNELAQDDKDFSVQLFLISPTSRVSIAPSTSQVTIIDDNSVTIGFQQGSYNVSKHQGYVTLKVKVLQGMLGRTVSLRIQTSDGSAIASQDYSSIDYILPSMNSSVTELTVDIPITVNELAEDDKDFSVQLFLISPTSRVSIAPSTTQVTIIDDNSVTIGFQQGSYNVSKHQGFITLKVKVLQGLLGRTVSLRIQTSDGSAVSSQDYTSIDYILPSMNSSVTELTVDIPITVNELAEDDKDFSVQLFLISPTSRVSIAPSTSQVTIIDDNSVTIGFQQGSYNVSKHQGSVTLKVKVLQGILGRTVSLHIQTSDGSAIASQDYTSINYILPSMNSSVTELTVDIPITVNELAQDDKDFSVQLSLISPTSRVSIAPSTSQVTIVDDNSVTIGFQQGSFNVSKHEGFVTLKVKVLQGILGRTVTLRIQTSDGSAIASQDYSSIDYILPSMNSSVTELTVDIPITVNELAEDDKDFSVQLFLISPTSRVSIAPSTTQVTIIDDNSVTIGFQQGSYNVSKHQGYVTLKVKVLQGILGRTVSLRIQTSDGSAVSPQDYSSINYILPSMNSSVTELTVDIPITVNELAQDDKDFSVQLSLISPTSRVSIAPSTSQVTIIDDNSVTIGFQQGSYQVLKHQGYVPLTVKVLQGILGRTVSLRIQTSNGSAIAPQDYSSIDYILPSMNSSVTELTVDIPITVNELAQDDKAFSVQLSLISPTSRVSIAPSTSQVTIVDDNNVTFGFDQQAYSISEGQGFVPLTVRVLQGTLGRTVSLHILTSDGSARASIDYAPYTDALVFNQLVSELTVGLTIVKDNIVEYNEMFFAVLSLDVVNSHFVLSPSNASVTIVNDNTAIVGFNDTSYEVSEADGSVSIEVAVLSGQLGRPVQLTFATHPDSASAGIDYTSVTSVVTLDPAHTHTYVDVPITRTSVYKDTVSFDVTLALTDPIPDGFVVDPSTAIVDIDNINYVTFGFMQTSYVVRESGGNVTLGVELLQGTLGQNVTITVATSSDADVINRYTPIAGLALQFSPSSPSIQYVTVPIINDHTVRPNAQFSVVLSSGLPRVILAPSTANVTILNDNSVLIGFAKASYVVYENMSSLPVVVQLEGNIARQAIVVFNTSDRTAIANSDYLPVSQVLTFDPNTAHSLVVNVPIIYSPVEKRSVEFLLTLSSTDPGISLSIMQAVVTILDTNVVTFKFSQPMIMVLESSGYGTLCVSRTGAIDRAVSLMVTGALQPGLGNFDQIVTIDSTVNTGCVNVTVFDDKIALKDVYTLNFTLHLVDTTDPNVVLDDLSHAVLVIVDDEELHVTLDIGTDVHESNTVVTCVRYDKMFATSFNISVIANGTTAVAGVDFTFLDTILVARPGDPSTCFTFEVLNDNSVENPESFDIFISIVQPSPEIKVLNDRATYNIIDNDDFVTIGFEQAVYRVLENASAVSLSVSIHSDTVLERPVTVVLNTNDMNATSGSDYSGILGLTLVFTNSTRTLTQSVNISDNGVVEGLKVFGVTLNTDDTAVILDQSSADVEIIDTNSITLDFEFSTYTVHESEGQVEVTLEIISGTLQRDVTVTVETIPGTAHANVDYVPITRALTFSGAVSSITFTVDLLDDKTVESLETFSVVLQSSDPAVDNTPARFATIEIVDNHTITIGFDKTVYTVDKKGSAVSLSVSIHSDEVLERPVTVVLNTNDMNATSGSDYEALVGLQLVFDNTTSIHTVQVGIKDDGAVEGLKVFGVTLSTDDQAVILDQSSAEVEIIDTNKITLGFAPSVYYVNETDGHVNVTVVIVNGTLKRDLTVTVRTVANTSIESVDYVPLTRVLTFSGAVSSITFTVDILDDNTVESLETFSVVLESSDPAVDNTPARYATIEIVDNHKITIGFGRLEYTVLEGLSQLVQIAVVPSSVLLERPVTVIVRSLDDTALASTNYVAVGPQTLTFTQGNLANYINLTTIDNHIVEGTKQLKLSLTTSDPAVVLSPSTAVVMITDVDSVVLGFDSPSYTTTQASEGLTVCVVLQKGQLQRPVTLSLKTSDITAVNTSTFQQDPLQMMYDYIAVNTTLTFNSTTHSSCVTVTILDSYNYQMEVTFSVTITSADPSVVIPDPTVTVTIQGNNSIPIGFVSVSLFMNENGGQIRVCAEIKSSIGLRDPAVVGFVTLPGSAQASKNYLPSNVSLVFTQDQRISCAVVTILDDNVVTGTLNFTARLSPQSPRETLSPETAVVNILNTDKTTIGFDDTMYTVPEGSTQLVGVTVQSNAVLGRPVTVTITSSDGTASASTNYVAVGPQTLTFTQGNLANYINLTTIDNHIVEGTKQLKLSLSSSDPAVVLSPSTAVVMVTNINTATIGPLTDGKPVTTSGTNATVCFGITSGTLGRDTSINVKTVDGSATAPTDYTLVNTQLEFNGSVSQRCVTVQLTNTTIYKDQANFSVVATAADGSVTLDPNTVPVVVNNTATLTIGFYPANFNVTKGTDQYVTICAKVLSGTLGTNITASATTHQGTAIDGDDFIGVVGVVLQFSPSQLQSCFYVSIIDSQKVEDPVDNFTVTLTTSAPRVTVQPDVATVGIIDDNFVNITDMGDVLAEDGEALIDIGIIGDIGRNVTVIVYTVDQTAKAPTNYIATNVTLTFVPNGPTQITVPIKIVDDKVSRNPQTFVVMITTRDPAVRISNSQIVVTIPNNNTVTIGLDNPSYYVHEGDGAVKLCAVLTNGVLERQVSVTMTTSDGTALAGTNYQSSAVTFSFGPGVTSSCVNVSILDDQVLQNQKTFSAQLSTASERVILNPSTASVNVINDNTVTISFRRPAYYYYTTNTSGYVTVQKTGTSAIPVSVTVSGGPSAQANIAPSAAPISTTVTFPPGGDAVQRVSFNITNHHVALKTVEAYNVSLSNPSQGVVLGQPSLTSVSIVDNEMVVVYFEQPSYSVFKNTTALSVCLVGDKGTAVPFVMTVTSVPNTAIEGLDYGAVNTTITMPASSTGTKQCFQVAILDNHVALDNSRTFSLSMGTSSGGVVVTSPSTLITILDSDVVTVVMAQPTYTVAEGQAVSVCATKDLATARPLSVTLNTQSGTATAGQDFTGGSFGLTFDTTAQNTQCVTITTLSDSTIESPETFSVALMPESDIAVGIPGSATVTITEATNVVTVNDTVVGDPLFSVPLYAPSSTQLFGSTIPALCYEVHGEEKKYFNLISDSGVSVNARYLNVNNYLNVIDQVAIRAVDSKGSISNIRVDLDGCALRINETAIQVYQFGGVMARQYSDRVRVSVPNCGRNGIQLVMWVICQNNTLTDPVTGDIITAAMIKFVVARGLNLSPESHGIIGQFWNVPVNMTLYTGPLRVGSSNQYPRYAVSVAHPLSPKRSFTGILYTYTWEFDVGVCLYAGNRQAGPIYEVESPNDPVIEGAYTDYIMGSAFATDFAYSRFLRQCVL